MAGNAEISWPHLRMRIEDNASFAHGFRILRYTGLLVSSTRHVVGWSDGTQYPACCCAGMLVPSNRHVVVPVCWYPVPGMLLCWSVGTQ